MLNRVNYVGSSGHAAQHDTITNRLLSVLDYGAKPNTDCTAAFQLALQDAYLTGQFPIIPQGRFTYTQPLALRGVSLNGSGWGTILDYRGSGDAIMLGDLSGSTLYEGSQVSNFILEGYSSLANANGITAYNVGNFLLSRVQTRGFVSGYGISLLDVAVSGNIIACVSKSNLKGLYMYKSDVEGYINAINVIGGEYQGCGTGIQVGKTIPNPLASIANGIVIKEAVIQGCGTGINFTYGHTFHVSECYFEACVNEALRVGTDQVSAGMVNLRNSWIYNTPVAVEAVGADNLLLDRCYFHYNTPIGVNLHSGAPLCILRDNFVFNGNAESVRV